MALAPFRKISKGQNSGVFVISEGVAPANYLLPHEGLPTFYSDYEDDRFETVIPKGTILTVVKNSADDSRIVPCNGTGSNQTWGDADTFDFESGATPENVSGDEDTVTVTANSVPIGCAQYDLHRPFDKGTSQGAGYIVQAYVEWPMVDHVNADILPGDLIRADHMGRPVKFTKGTTPHYAQVGKVIEVEYFATNFDDGLLSYMQLPSDPGALKEVYSLTKSGTYSGKLGIRKNLDVDNVVGAFRVQLTL